MEIFKNQNERQFMASLKTYITFTTLSRIPEECLKRRFEGIHETFVSKGFILKNGKYDLHKIARFLQDNCPSDLENFICSFALVAKSELYDRICEKLASFGIETSPTDDLETLAAMLAERDMTACNAIAARKMADETHSYSHYIPTVPHSAQEIGSEELLNLKQKVLSPYFAKNGRSGYIDIYPHITNKFAFYCIAHGAPKTRERSVGDEEEASFHTFRPELVDIVRINLSNAEISVFTQKNHSRGFKEFYVENFGRLILPDSKYIPHKKFKISALSNTNIFNVGEFSDRISSITPMKFSYIGIGGCKLDASKNVDAAYLDCVENNRQIISMTFNVCFADNPKKKHRVSIHSDSRSEFPIGTNEEIIEDYFFSKGIMRDIYREETFTLETQEVLLSN